MVDAEQVETVQRSLTDIPVSRYVDDFVQLVSDHFREEHGTEFYADRLCITPNYLNKIVRQSLGKSAKTYILDQILAEASRQLKYTTLPVADIAVQLHFDTATYFVRLFKKHMAMTPLEYRENG
jgi:AraC-like DNA-binding protein